MHKKSLVMLLILLSLLSCKEDVQLEPEEVVNAFLEAVENQDASNLVSYLSEGEISNLEPFVEEQQQSESTPGRSRY